MHAERRYNKDERHSPLEKYTSHFIERVVCERELETEQNCNILTPTPMATTAFLSCSPGLLNLGPEGPASLGAGFLYRIFSPTHLISNWLTSCLHPGYIIIWHPLFFLRASHIALIQPIHGQGYILIFLDRMHLLFTQVHFLFSQPSWVGGQYTTPYLLHCSIPIVQSADIYFTFEHKIC